MSSRKPATFWPFLALLLFLAGPVVANVITSPSDDRSYVAYQLENGLQVLLISDAHTAKAAAALDDEDVSLSKPLHRARWRLVGQRERHDPGAGAAV